MVSQTFTPVIEARDIRRSFRSTKKEAGFKASVGLLLKPQYQVHEALKGINFTIESGAFIGLIGENGAGKTTLLKILSGLIPPTTGEARVLGQEPFKRSLDFRKQIALVMGQKAQLWWDLPAVDAFDLLRAIYEIPHPIYRDRLKTLSNLLGVDRHLNTQIRRLSLGERMKMELIGALLHWPRVIFLDEPTIGLDVLAAHRLREFLKEFNRREKATIILTSHNMDDIETLCSRVIMLRRGEMIYDGPPGKLTRGGEQRLRVRLRENPTPEEIASTLTLPIESVEVTETETGEEEAQSSRLYYITIQSDQITGALQALMGRYHLVDMGIEEQSLERVIQRIYEGDAL